MNDEWMNKWLMTQNGQGKEMNFATYFVIVSYSHHCLLMRKSCIVTCKSGHSIYLTIQNKLQLVYMASSTTTHSCWPSKQEYNLSYLLIKNNVCFTNVIFRYRNWSPFLTGSHWRFRDQFPGSNFTYNREETSLDWDAFGKDKVSENS